MKKFALLVLALILTFLLVACGKENSDNNIITESAEPSYPTASTSPNDEQNDEPNNQTIYMLPENTFLCVQVCAKA